MNGFDDMRGWAFFTNNHQRTLVDGTEQGGVINDSLNISSHKPPPYLSHPAAMQCRPVPICLQVDCVWCQLVSTNPEKWLLWCRFNYHRTSQSLSRTDRSLMAPPMRLNFVESNSTKRTEIRKIDFGSSAARWMRNPFVIFNKTCFWGQKLRRQPLGSFGNWKSRRYLWILFGSIWYGLLRLRLHDAVPLLMIRPWRPTLQCWS